MAQNRVTLLIARLRHIGHVFVVCSHDLNRKEPTLGSRLGIRGVSQAPSHCYLLRIDVLGRDSMSCTGASAMRWCYLSPCIRLHYLESLSVSVAQRTSVMRKPQTHSFLSVADSSQASVLSQFHRNMSTPASTGIYSEAVEKTGLSPGVIAVICESKRAFDATLMSLVTLGTLMLPVLFISFVCCCGNRSNPNQNGWNQNQIGNNNPMDTDSNDQNQGGGQNPPDGFWIQV